MHADVTKTTQLTRNSIGLYHVNKLVLRILTTNLIFN